MTKQRKSLLSVLVLAAICLFALSFSFGAGQIIDKEPVTAVADTTYCVHEYGNGKCTKCGNCQHYVSDFTTCKCANCGEYMYYRVIVNNIFAYYNDSLEAGAQIPENATVNTATLMPISAGDTPRFYFTSERSYTLDLDGKSVNNQSGSAITNSTIVIKDSVGSGSLVLGYNVNLSNCNVTINNVKMTSNGGVLFGNKSTGVINGGTYDTKFYLNDVGQFTFNSGTIKTLYFQDSNSVTNTKLYGGTISSIEAFRVSQYATILAEGKAYALTSDGSLVKLANMNSSKAVTIVDCVHSWSNGVCEYCGEVCAHEHYTNGKCDTCGMECTHENVNTSKSTCNDCGAQIVAAVTTDGATVYYSDITKARINLKANGTLKFLSDLKTSLSINVGGVTIDLNGKNVGYSSGSSTYYLTVRSSATIIDSSSSKTERNLYLKCIYSSAQINVNLNKYVNCYISQDAGDINFYDGKIVAVTFEDSYSLLSLLLTNYALRKTDENGSELVTYKDCGAITEFNGVVGGTVKSYYTVEECLHTDFDDDFKCVYCNADVDLKQAVKALRERLNSAVEELNKALADKVDSDTLTKKINDLTLAYIEADNVLKSELQGVDQGLAKDIADLKTAYADADKKLQAGIDQVQTNLEDAEERLKGLIDAKASSTDLTAAIAKLDSEYKAADELLKTNIGKDITALDAAYKKADTELQAGINQVQTNLEDAEERLKGLINAKANSTDLTAAIEKLNSEYKAADELLKTNIGKDISALDAAYKKADTELQAGIDQVQTNLEDAEERLKGLINAKASSAELTAAIAKLDSEYKAADELLKTNIGKDITALDAAYKKADTELQAGIDQVQTNLEDAEERLKNLISAKASSTDLTTAIAKLDSEYKAADELLKTNIGKDITALGEAYKEADESLQAGIDQVQANLEAAEERLKGLIDAKASSAELTTAIAKLDSEYKAADELLKTNIGKDISALDKAYKEADTELQAGIDRVQANLEDAETRLKNLISAKASSTDLTTAIAKLDSEYKAADELLKTNIGKDISALDAAYKKADTELQAGINRVQANLEDAETRLKGLIDEKTSSEDLSAAIKQLQGEYKAADELLKTNMGKDITALDAAYKKADTELQAGIDQVQTNLEDAEKRLKGLIDEKASSTDLTAAIEKLNSEYKAADELLKTNIGKDITALDAAYKKADTELQAGIDQVQTNLEDAETRLKTLISEKASSAELTAAIKQLQDEYKAADTLLKSDIGDLQTKDEKLEQMIKDLTKTCGDAHEALWAGIKLVQDNLDEAKRQLEEKDKDLESRLNSVKENGEKNDTIFMIINIVLGVAVVALAAVLIIGKVTDKRRNIK